MNFYQEQLNFLMKFSITVFFFLFFFFFEVVYADLDQFFSLWIFFLTNSWVSFLSVIFLGFKQLYLWTFCPPPFVNFAFSGDHFSKREIDF